jgi:transcriptional regulator with XRE-family HTH domain
LGNFKELVGKKIKARRREKGFTSQRALAIAVGADRTRVSRWESGENLPDPAYKALLAEKLDVPETFFDSVDSPQTDSRADMILDIQEELKDLSLDKLKELKSQIQGTAQSEAETKFAQLVKIFGAEGVETLLKTRGLSIPSTLREAKRVQDLAFLQQQAEELSKGLASSATEKKSEKGHQSRHKKGQGSKGGA